jgi:hypothetical protein
VSTAKQDIESLIQRLPDDCSIEDVQYHLYILEKIRRGVESAEAGRVKTQEEVEERFSQWSHISNRGRSSHNRSRSTREAISSL